MQPKMLLKVSVTRRFYRILEKAVIDHKPPPVARHANNRPMFSPDILSRASEVQRYHHNAGLPITTAASLPAGVIHWRSQRGSEGPTPQPLGKNIKFVITRFVFQTQSAQKTVFGRGSAPDPAGGAYGAHQTP